MKRRNFIKTTAIVAPVLSLFPPDLSLITRESVAGKLEKRSLGKTGEMLSVIGLGGIVVMDVSPEEASASVKTAIDAGVNYFDISPSYGDAETKLGPALEPYRKNVFLSCKTDGRNKEDSRKELEQSLKNMHTDHFDLYQFHAVTTLKDVQTILGKGGAIETFLEAREEGKIRFIGFSAHSVEAATALINGFDFDTIMFPVNFRTWYAGNFGPQVLALAQEKKMGIIALKSMANTPWPENADRSKYNKCWYEPLTNEGDILTGLRFTLSHPVTTLIPPGEPQLFRKALDLRKQIKSLNNEQVNIIKTKALDSDPLFKYPSITPV
jgi:Predicted oxidoreductases of the aldo/keto reductase family